MGKMIKSWHQIQDWPERAQRANYCAAKLAKNYGVRVRAVPRHQSSFNYFQVRAFTLIELLVVIAIIAILAALLLPVLSRAKDKGYQTTCCNNFRQLAIGFQLYEDESTDQFPAPGSKKQYGPQPEDWIWWESDRDVKSSSIAKFIGSFNPDLFTCPADRDARQMQTQSNLATNAYRFSYEPSESSPTSG
jgi:prepilin-type N-terminal cleavage/methylation domain-containing protein